MKAIKGLYEGQREIKKAVRNLHITMNKYHKQVMAKLEMIHDDVLFNLELTKILVKGTSSCDSFFSHMNGSLAGITIHDDLVKEGLPLHTDFSFF